MAQEQELYRHLSEIMSNQPQLEQRLSERQMRMLFSLLRLSHPKVARWSSWSILTSPRWPRKSKPLVCVDTDDYNTYIEVQELQRHYQQLRKQMIRRHVQDRVAKQKKMLDEEAAAAAVSQDTATTTTTPATPASSLAKDTNSAVQKLLAEMSAELASDSTTTSSPSKVPALKDPSTFQKHKRSIRWALQNNTIRRFDKNIPLQDVRLPPMDRRPVKSALKVRTPNGIQKPSANSKYFPPRKTAVDFF